VYVENGTFTASVTVTDAYGFSSSPATSAVTIANVAPNPFHPDRSVLVGQGVNFGGFLNDPGLADTHSGTIDFGDGVVEPVRFFEQPLGFRRWGIVAPHQYASQGTFHVTLTITDDDGGVASRTAVVCAGNSRCPVPRAGGPYSADEGAAVSFDASESFDPDDDALTFDWDFGDGTTLANGGATPSHSYADNGNFTVTLKLTDAGGAQKTGPATVSVSNAAPDVGEYAGASISRAETYTSSGSFSDPGADTWTATVDYGDGAGPQALALNGKNFNLSHVYGMAGTFTVTVIVTDDDGGTDTQLAQVIVTLNRPPVANAGGPYSANEGAAVSFDASGSSDPDGDALTFDWTFGDGSVLLNGGATPSHTYADNSDFNVTLKVTDAHGLSTSADVTVHVNNVAPIVSPFAGATIMRSETYASAGSFGDPGADSWSATVNYSDGGGPQALGLDGKNFSLNHAYLSAGTFTVTVAVSDDDAGVGNNTATVRVLTPQEGATSIIGGYIDDLVRSGALEAQQGRFLMGAVELIVDQLDRHPGNKQPALNALTVLENRIRSLVQQGRLSAANAAALLALRDRLERVINAS
jgi:PKD repeat protein